jgi:alkanesulfonate monooxygenase SsuD/methylene tetrahydromethanopterin reductase-like flavin-dependent oxidoreductase (luciferase family)
VAFEIGIRFDMRSPDWATARKELYTAAHDMAAFADSAGFDVVLVGEHHGSTDGYTSASFVVAASLAARTRFLRVRLRAILLPLHDPVHVAEQLTTLDVLTGGRVEAVFGLGYVPAEFAMFGVPLSSRVPRLECGIAVLRDALAGRRFDFDGRQGRVTPQPVDPHLPLYLGGGVPAAARRAARLQLGFAPLMNDGALTAVYASECRRLGREPGPVMVTPDHYAVFVTEDPGAFWRLLEPHARHNADQYFRLASGTTTITPFASFAGDNLDQVKNGAGVAVVTPDECIDLAGHAAVTGRGIQFVPLLGGLDPSLGWSSLHLFAEAVLPVIRPGPGDRATP